MKEFFHKIGCGICYGAIHVAYFFWGVATHILYFPHVVYTSKESKKLLKKPCIIIANHTSHKDGSFVPQVLPGKKINVLVTTKWYNKKSLHIFFKHLRYIPIDLLNGDTAWMDRCKEKLEKGESVLIFPEGALSKTGELLEFQPGVLMLARFSEAPIIPMAITGGYKKFHRQTITVGAPVDFDVKQKGRPSVIMKEGAEYCRVKVQELKDLAQGK